MSPLNLWIERLPFVIVNLPCTVSRAETAKAFFQMLLDQKHREKILLRNRRNRSLARMILVTSSVYLVGDTRQFGRNV